MEDEGLEITVERQQEEAMAFHYGLPMPDAELRAELPQEARRGAGQRPGWWARGSAWMRGSPRWTRRSRA